MNNDLISREALKKAFYELINVKFAGTYDFEKLIDNAPAVEPFEPDYVGAERFKARQRGYTEGYHYGMEIGKTLNPKIKQGEWIAHEDMDEWYECNKCFCGNTYFDGLPNFCPNCGADMRKKQQTLDNTDNL